MNNNINSLSTNTCNMTNTSNTSNIINEDSAFNLFLTPHQYAGSKSGKKMLSGNNLSSNMGNISNVNNKMKSLNFKQNNTKTYSSVYIINYSYKK